MLRMPPVAAHVKLQGLPHLSSAQDRGLHWRPLAAATDWLQPTCNLQQGDEQGCGLAELQAVIDAATLALQTLMQDARGSLIR